jgi:hypothetical protein
VVYRYKDIEGRQIRQERTPGEIQGDVRTRSFTRYSTDVTRFARRGSGDVPLLLLDESGLEVRLAGIGDRFDRGCWRQGLGQGCFERLYPILRDSYDSPSSALSDQFSQQRSLIGRLTDGGHETSDSVQHTVDYCCELLDVGLWTHPSAIVTTEYSSCTED